MSFSFICDGCGKSHPLAGRTQRRWSSALPLDWYKIDILERAAESSSAARRVAQLVVCSLSCGGAALVESSIEEMCP